MELHDWFIRLTIPLVLLMVYHSARARRERLFPETEEGEPLLTVDEYEARKAAREAADATTSTIPTQEESTHEN